jgi:hypothetical protein
MPVSHRVGIYLGVVQFLFALTWVIYVLYLPQLAAQAGIPKQYVLPILMLDQVIFAVMDLACGVAADRVARVTGRLGRAVLVVTLVSCAAFLALPFVAPGAGAPAFLALTVLWSASSSALRAPPLVLLAKYTPAARQPWLASLSLLGLGVAAGAAPYVGIALAGVDARIPFAVASLALAAATLAMLWAEKTLAGGAAPPHVPATGPAFDALAAAFLAAVLLLALGTQMHFALNTATQYLRFATPAELPQLMPLFWLGFNVLMLPAGLASSRHRAIAVMAVAGLVGAAALYAAASAGSLAMLVAAQLLAGGAWACVLAGAFGAALAIGRTGREGAVTGGVFALLAVATFARMAVVFAELNKDAQYAGLLAGAPIAAWLVAGLAAAAVAAVAHRSRRAR